ncbi:MAG: hypothetical protein HY769_02625 [Candidatus Stahlbacteria bacterium]|nr:hypothetical protein [Candidatus Stahlbacteria bacterium]
MNLKKRKLRKRLLVAIIFVMCRWNGVVDADSVQVKIKFNTPLAKSLTLIAMYDYDPLLPGNCIESGDDTVGFGNVIPDKVYHIGSTKGTTTLVIGINANESWELKTVAEGKKFSNGINNILVRRLEWAADANPVAQNWYQYWDTEELAGAGSTDTLLYYDYRLQMKWADPVGDNYWVNTYWKLY